MNLTFAIGTVRKKIQEIKQKQIEELAPYEETLKNLKAINTTCEMCEGRKEVLIRVSPEDKGIYYKCALCNGTGRNENAPAAIAQWN